MQDKFAYLYFINPNVGLENNITWDKLYMENYLQLIQTSIICT